MKQTIIKKKIDNHALHEVKYVPTKDKNIKQFFPANEVKKSDTLFLYFVMITGITPLLVGGTSMVWSSSAIIKLRSSDPTINPIGHILTTTEVSKLLGIPAMVALLGSGLLPKLSDLIGRKRSLQVMSFTMLIGFVGVAFSPCLELMITFLAILNFAFIGITGVFPIYLTEVCEDHNRAKFGCFMSIFFPLGQLYSYTIGPLFSLRNFTLLCTAPLLPSLVLFFFAPESPVYSLKKGRKEECMTALQKLRNYNNSKELEIDFKHIEDSLSIPNQKKGNGVMKLFTTREGRIGLMLGILPVILQNLSGVMVIMPLMAPILNNSGSNISGNTIAVCVGVVKVFSFSFTSLIVERVGRKPLMAISCVASGLPISVLGLYFYLKHINSPILIHFHWVPLVCILLYVIGFAIGLGPIPVPQVSILFPPDLRSTATSLILTTGGVILTSYVSIYPLLSEAIGTHWCMWIFGGTLCLGSFLIYFVIPETQGKSTLEVQELLRNY